MARTMPFVIFRAAVYFGIAAVLVVATGAGEGWGVGAFGDAEFQASSMAWGGIIGFGATMGVLFLVRDHGLHIVKAGHIAVMVDLMQGGTVPGGRGQIDHARAVVTERIGEASALFARDQVIKGVVGAVTGLSAVVFVLMLAPAAAVVVWLIPGAWSAGGVVFALVFA